MRAFSTEVGNAATAAKASRASAIRPTTNDGPYTKASTAGPATTARMPAAVPSAVSRTRLRRAVAHRSAPASRASR